MTIRGSVGFELPCLGVPVLTAGTGFYSGRGFTVDSDTADEYLGRLAQIQDIQPPDQSAVELARRHAHALFRLRQTRFRSFKTAYMPLDRIDHPFEATIVVSARTPEELAADLDRVGALGGAFTRARLPRAVGRSCRSAAARAAGRPVSHAAARSSRPAAQPSSRSSRNVVSFRLPYG